MPAKDDADGTMYRFLECKAAQYMTAGVKTVTPHTDHA